MFWPDLLSSEQHLPEVQDLYLATKLKQSKNEQVEITYKPYPHLDEIVDVISNTNSLPYIILTYRGLYLFDSKTNSPIAAHIRSDQSINELGSNLKIKRSPNGKIFAIETTANVLLIYTIRNELSDELLTIFNNDGKIIQNGLPIISSTSMNAVDGSGSGIGLKSGGGSTSGGGSGPGSGGIGGDNIVKAFINVLLSSDSNEVPVFDYGLRLKLIFNIQSPLTDYEFMNNAELLLCNSKPHAFQIVRLGDSGNNLIKEENDNIEFILVDELTWYKTIGDDSFTKSIFYSYEMDCFLWLNNKGDCWLVKQSDVKQPGDESNGTKKKIEFKGKLIYECPSQDKDNLKVDKCAINHFKNLIYFTLKNGDLLIYKFRKDLSLTKLKTVKKHRHSNELKDIILDFDGDSVILLYKNGWNIYSMLGNLNFSTYDYDNLNWLKPNHLKFINSFELLLINDSNKIFKLNLISLNHSKVLNSVTYKRPILITKDKLSIFKAYDKNLIDHHHDSLNQSTNRETHIWLDLQLPLTFRIHNTEIKCSSCSDDGNFICIIGNNDVLIYSILINEWKILTNSDDVKINKNPARQCLWWKNHLILGSKTYEKLPKSEIVVFSTQILEKYESFSYDNVIWGFNFSETKVDEDFLHLNVDLFNDELIVITDQLNCYTWKLLLQSLPSNHNNNSDGNKNSKLKRKTVLSFKRLNVYQLKNCFDKEDSSIVSNFGTIIKTNGDDLLVLSNCDLTYIKKDNNATTNQPRPPTYHSYNISESVEAVNRLTPNLISVFDGSQIIHFDLSNEKYFNNLKPIKIQIGNEIQKDEESDYIIDSNGTTSYPLTLINDKNMIFGIEIDYSSLSNLRVESTKKNYLNDLVDHYIKLNLEIEKTDVTANKSGSVNVNSILSISSIYKKFHRFKHFQFVLELLLVSYIQDCYELEISDKENAYFIRLLELIKMTGQENSIFLGCLKKIEIQYWSIFFKKYNQTPRQLLNEIFKVYKDYKLSAHFFIIMLNYEKEENEDNKIDETDLSLINEILLKLILIKDFETSFELIRFIKIIDDKICSKIIINLEDDLKEYSN